MRRNTSRLLIVFITLSIYLLFSISCVFNHNENVKNGNLTDEDYAVYSTLIKKMIIRNSNPTKAINISDTVPFIDEDFIIVDESKTFTIEEQIQEMKEDYALANESTLRDFITKQHPPLKLQSKFDFSFQYNLVNEKRIKDNEGRAFKQVISFPRVGFNEDKTQAFVGINYYCGLCGFGSYVLLEKQNGIWQIKEEFVSWKS